MLMTLFWISVFLAVWAVTGHAMWLAITAAWRAFVAASRGSGASGKQCPQCGHFLDIAGTCGACGWGGSIPQSFNCRAAAARLEELYRQGKIDEFAYVTATRALRAAQRDDGARQAPQPEVVPTTPADATFAAAPDAPTEVDSPAAEEIFDAVATEGPAVIPPEPLSPASFSPAPSVPPAPPDDVLSPPSKPPFRAIASVHPLEAPEPETPTKTAVVRPALGAMLRAFMDERNIHWGELASGILIVGSAIGLVVSLRETLRALSDQIPYFPALLLMLGTAAFHGAGIYTLRYWKLRSTSRGVLTIGMLLVPLSFAAGLILSGTGASRIEITSPWYWAAVIVGVAGYGTVVYFSSRALDPISWFPLSLGVLGPSIGQLVIDRFSQSGVPSSVSPFVLTGLLLAVPLASFLGAVMMQLRRFMRRRHVTAVSINRSWAVVGISTFSLAVATAWLLVGGGSPWRVLAETSPWLTLALAALAGMGLAIAERSDRPSLSVAHTAASAVTILSAFAMLGLLFAAWPRVDVLVANGVLVGIVCAALAIVGRLPWLWAGCSVAWSFAALLISHRLLGTVPWRPDSAMELVWGITTGRSAAVLLGCGVLSMLSAAAAVRRQRLAAAMPLGAGALVVVLASYLIACYAGLWTRVDLDWASAVLGIDAVVVAIVLWYRRDPMVQWAGAVFWLVFSWHAVWSRSDWMEGVGAAEWTDGQKLLGVCLVHSAVMSILAAVAGFRRAFPRPEIVAWTAFATAGASLVLLAYNLEQSVAFHAGVMAVVAIIWWLVFVATRATWVFAAADGIATSAVALLAVTAILQRVPRQWPNGWWEERVIWEAIVASLSLWGVATAFVGWLRLKSSFLARWLPWSDTRISSFLMPPLAVALVCLSIDACLGKVLLELGTDRLYLLKDELAQAWGAWGYRVPWLAIGIVLLGGWWRRLERVHFEAVLTWVLASAAMCGFAASWASENHAATVVLLGLVAIFVLLWNTAFSWPWLVRWLLGEPVGAECSRERNEVRLLTISLSGIVIVAITMVAHELLLGGARPPEATTPEWMTRVWQPLFYVVPIAVLGCSALMASLADRRWYWLVVTVFSCHWIASLLVCYEFQPRINIATEAEMWLVFASWQAFVGGLVVLGWQVATTRGRLKGPLEAFVGATYASLVGVFFFLIGATVVLNAWFTWSSGGVIFDAQPLWIGCVGVVTWLAALGWRLRGSEPMSISPLIAGRFCLTVILPGVMAAMMGYGSLELLDLILVGWGVAAMSATCLTLSRMQRGSGVASDGASGRERVLGWSHAARREAVLWLSLIVALLLAGCYESLSVFWLRSALALPGVILVLTVLAVVFSTRRLAYPTLALGVWVGLVLAYGFRATLSGGDWFWVTLLGLTLVSVLWLGVELYRQWRQAERWDGVARFSGVHLVGSGLAVSAMLLMVMFALTELVSDWSNRNANDVWLGTLFGWICWSVLAFSFVAALFDRATSRGLWGLLATGAIGVCFVLESLALLLLFTTVEHFATALVLGLSLYGALSAEAGRWMNGISDRSSRLFALNVRNQWLRVKSVWIAGISLLLAILSCAAVALAIWQPDRGGRVVAALVPLFGAYAAQRFAVTQWSRALLSVTFVFATWTVVLLGWATMSPPSTGGDDVRYLAQFSIVLLSLGVVYSTVFPLVVSAKSDWNDAARRAGIIVFVVGASAVLGLIFREAGLFMSGVPVPLDLPRLIVLSLVIACSAAALLVMAVMPNRDPLGLSETGRMGYVYLSQVCLTLAFAHVYFVRPDWFQSVLRPYWPYMLMLLAFVGVGIGEWARRTGWRVLGEPLQRTGGFLPLVPAVGVWLDTAQSQHSLVYFFAGLVYVAIAVMRKSTIAAVTAALLGNVAYWVFLKDMSVPFYAQPQVWLVPPTLAVLAAAEFNRSRLSANQISAVRYICIMIVYLSSSGETFMKLLAPDAPADWLRPLILLSLSVAGIFAGLIMRVRAFLFLGFSFLLLSMIAMVWSSTRVVAHTWPWWAFGIGMGIVILIIFGLFEKHRDRAIALAAKLKEWES